MSFGNEKLKHLGEKSRWNIWTSSISSVQQIPFPILARYFMSFIDSHSACIFLWNDIWRMPQPSSVIQGCFLSLLPTLFLPQARQSCWQRWARLEHSSVWGYWAQTPWCFIPFLHLSLPAGLPPFWLKPYWKFIHLQRCWIFLFFSMKMGKIMVYEKMHYLYLATITWLFHSSSLFKQNSQCGCY